MESFHDASAVGGEDVERGASAVVGEDAGNASGMSYDAPAIEVRAAGEAL